MILPSRLALLAFCGVTALLLLGPLFPPIALIACACDAVIILLVLVEGRYILRDDAVLAERLYETRMSLGEENKVLIRLRNLGGRDLILRVRDELPEGFGAPNDTWGPLRLNAQSETELEYTVTAPGRGRFYFGDIYLRASRVNGWAIRRVRIPLRQEARVYPNLIELRRYDTVRQSRKLSSYGIHALRKFGKGSEFESLREYTAGDDYKDVNWKATARRGLPITQLFQVERSQNVMIALDTGRMMSTKEGDLTKCDYAVNAALMLAYVAKRTGDKVGLTMFSDSVKAFIPVASGNKQLAKIIDALYPVKPDGFFVDYKAMVHHLKLNNKKRGLIILFTDFPDAESGWELYKNVSRLRRNHLVVCVTLADRYLNKIKDGHPEQTLQAYEKMVALELLEEREEILRKLAQRGVHVLDLPSHRVTMDTLNKYIEIKSRGFL